MTRFLLVGLTVFAMTTGAALAQSSSSETVTHEGGPSVTITNGGESQTERTRTHTDSLGDTETRSRTRTTEPNGDTTTTHSTTDR